MSSAKISVTVLEARNRIGGRINTHIDPKLPAPVELGAEFVHGLATANEDALRDQSLEALSHIFAVPPNFLEDKLVEFYTHNWTADQFSRGAYSYIPVGGLTAQAELADPVEDTIYFAGEAVNTLGHPGTVHGAIASGLRAAREIECSLGTKQ